MTREEALQKIRRMTFPKETMEILEALAPELAESEDERIRKAIGVAICGTTAISILEANGTNLPDALAFLGARIKQKEQKPNPGANSIADWSAFRREAAKDVLCAIIAKNNFGYCYDVSDMMSASAIAIAFADELIKQLKKKNK